MKSGAVPLLCSVIVRSGLCVPAVWVPKSEEPGVTETTGVVPVPARPTSRSPPSVVTFNDALLGPLLEGVKLSVMSHPPPTATGAVQPFDVIANCAAAAPPRLAPVTVIGATPLLPTVTVRPADVVPDFCAPNVTDVGSVVATGTDEPVTAMSRGEPVVLSAIVILPVGEVPAWGVYVTSMVQALPAGRLVPTQVSVTAKSGEPL